MNSGTDEALSIIPGSIGTSSGGTLIGRTLRIICVAGALTLAGTDSADASTSLTQASPQTTNSGLSANHRQHAGSAIMELRRLSGMTWDQLAALFDVSRRTVHFWASGKALNAANEMRLYRILSTVRRIDRGSAQENRDALLSAQADGIVPMDLLRADHYVEVIDALGEGIGQQFALTPLSPAARAARMPMKPEVLANAQQGTIRRDSGRTRAARAVRVKHRPQGDHS